MVELQLSFGLAGVEHRQRAGHIRRLHVADPSGDVDDPVVGVAEIVDDDPSVGRDAGHGLGLDGKDHDLLVPHMIVFHVGPHGQGSRLVPPVEEDGRAGDLDRRQLSAAEVIDESTQGTFVASAFRGDGLASALPGRHDGEHGEADQQGQPCAVDELGQVGRHEQQVHGEQHDRADGDQPPGRAPFRAGDIEEQQGGDGDGAGDGHAEREGQRRGVAEGEHQVSTETINSQLIQGT